MCSAQRWIRFHPMSRICTPIRQRPRPRRQAFRDTTALKVGIVWAGSPTRKHDRSRSLAAETVLPRLVMPDVQLYSLQKELRPADAPVLAGLGSDVIDLAPGLGDFADTAAAVAALDLVIAGRHLGGASGRRHGASGVGPATVCARLALAA